MSVFLKSEIRCTVSFARFFADINAQVVPLIMESPRSDNGTEFVKLELVQMLNRRGIRREYTPVSSPCVVGRRIALTQELEMTSCLSVVSCEHASDVLNMKTRARVKWDMHSPYRRLYGRAPFARLIIFLNPGLTTSRGL